MDSDDQFSARTLPNLLRLEAHCISFPAYDEPHRALQHLTCPVDSEGYYQLLFQNFPRLVEVQLIVCGGLTTLPAVSLPCSLRSIVLRPDNYHGLHVPSLLWNGAGQQIPRLALQRAHSLYGVLPLFLGSHAHNVELRLNSRDQELELKTLPTDGVASRKWTITPWSLIGEYLGGLETRGCERVTSISVVIEQLGRLFSAQLHTPGLEDLEFRLVGSQKEPLLQADDGDFFIRAPRLKRVAFTMDGSVSGIREHLDEIRSALDILRSSFRALIIYDADLLDSITLSAPAGSLLDIACPEFAGFAKHYIVSERV